MVKTCLPCTFSSSCSNYWYWVPVRNGYGGLVPTQNKASYDAAVAAQGPDNQDTKLWWDTK